MNWKLLKPTPTGENVAAELELEHIHSNTLEVSTTGNPAAIAKAIKREIDGLGA